MLKATWREKTELCHNYVLNNQALPWWPFPQSLSLSLRIFPLLLICTHVHNAQMCTL